MARVGNSGIAHTCPDIDKVIREINSAIKSAEWGIKNPELEYSKSNYTDIIDGLYNLETIMEEIRSANLGLRDYGDEQYSKVEELENEISDLESKIEDLESKIEDLEIERDELKSEIEDLEQESNNY